MATVLVTGGSGFIGSHIVDALVLRGDRVVVIDIAPKHEEWGNAEAKYIQRDIRDERLADVFMQEKPDIVMHLAAHIDDRASVQESWENGENNIIGTVNVLEAARVSGAKRVVFASTGVTYGKQEHLPIKEDALCNPLTPYAVSKLAGERYVHYFAKQLGMSGCALRLANVYGPRQNGSKECGAIAIFIKRMINNEPIFLNGTGETTRDYVFVRDVAKAFLLAGESGEEGVINIGTGKETTTKEIFTHVTKANEGVAYVPRPEVQDAVARISLASQKAKEKLGWTAETTLEVGVQETMAWYARTEK